MYGFYWAALYIPVKQHNISATASHTSDLFHFTKLSHYLLLANMSECLCLESANSHEKVDRSGFSGVR